MKLIIAGSRSVNEHDHMLVEKAIALSGLGILEGSSLNIDEVVCGMARGADTLGRNWALIQGLPYIDMPAAWNDITTEGAVVKLVKNGPPERPTLQRHCWSSTKPEDGRPRRRGYLSVGWCIQWNC